MDQFMPKVIEGMKILVEWLIVLALLAPLGWGAYKLGKIILKPLKRFYDHIADSIVDLEKKLVHFEFKPTTYRKTPHEKTKIGPRPEKKQESGDTTTYRATPHEKTKINPNAFDPGIFTQWKTYFTQQQTKPNQNNSKQEKPKNTNPVDEDEDEYLDMGYQAAYLLTRNEWYEFRKLRDLAGDMGLVICPKVRLLDIVEPRRGEYNYMSLLGKVKSKHVDFVICDPDLRIKAILELDDNSHNRKDRQDRDEFVDAVLHSVGYTVIHTRSVTERTLDPIKPKAEPAGEQG